LGLAASAKVCVVLRQASQHTLYMARTKMAKSKIYTSQGVRSKPLVRPQLRITLMFNHVHELDSILFRFHDKRSFTSAQRSFINGYLSRRRFHVKNLPGLHLLLFFAGERDPIVGHNVATEFLRSVMVKMSFLPGYKWKESVLKEQPDYQGHSVVQAQITFHAMNERSTLSRMR